MSKRPLLVSFAFLFVLVLGQRSYSQEKKLDRLTLATSTVGLGRIPLLVAQEQRLFQKHGLEVNIVYIRGASTSLQSLLAGEVQLVVGGGQGTIGASRPGTSTDFVLERLLPRVGLIPGKDVKLLPTGLLVSEERLALLVQKRVDATLANQESVAQFQHKGHPLTVLADALAFGVNSTVDFSSLGSSLGSGLSIDYLGRTSV